MLFAMYTLSGFYILYRAPSIYQKSLAVQRACWECLWLR